MRDKCVGQSRPGEHNGMFGVYRYGEANPFFGKHHSKETNDRNRQAHLGKTHSEEEKQLISASLKGRVPYWLIGKPMSEEQKGRLRISVPRGESSPHWKGGRTPVNIAIRCSPRFKAWSKEVKERDNYTCQKCGQVGGELHSDHILPFYNNPELRFELLNGRTLCVNCHRQTETYGRQPNLIEV